MKIETLTLQNFGAYHQKNSIDFRHFYSENLLLIHGQTGSGKSTLLDGIVYALYGVLCDESKGDTFVISDYKGKDEKSEVCLVFSLGPRRYKIYRTPAQEREKKNQKGFTTEKADAQMYEWQGDWQLLAAGTRDVSERIQETLGLDKNRFMQMIVLPQGKFRDFILAKSDDREKLLAQIFDTHMQDEWLKALKENKDALLSEYEEAQKRKAWHLQQIKESRWVKKQKDISGEAQEQIEALAIMVSEDKRKKEEHLGQLKKEQQKQIEMKEQLRLFEQAHHRFCENQKQQKALDEKKEEMAQREYEIALFDRGKKALSQFEALKIHQKHEKEERLKKNTLAGSLDALKDRGAAYALMASELAQEKEALTSLDKALSDIDEMISKIEKYQRAKEKLLEHIQAAEQFQKRKENLQKQIEDLNQEIKEGHLATGQMMALREKEFEWEKEESLRLSYKELLQKREAEQKGWEALIEQKEKKGTAFEKKEKQYEQSRKSYEQAAENDMKAQAYRLAQGLEEGVPCPVCGAKHHLHKAEKPLDFVEKEILKEKKGQMEKLQIARDKAQVDFFVLEGKQKDMAASLSQLAQSVATHPGKDIDEDAIKTLRSAMEEQKKQYEMEILKGEQAQAQLEIEERALKKTQENLAQAKEERVKFQAIMQGIFEVAPEIQDWAKKKESLKAKWAQLEGQIEKKEEKLSQYQREKDKKIHLLEESEASLKGLEMACDRERSGFLASLFEAEISFGEMRILFRLKEDIDQIRKTLQAYTGARRQIEEALKYDANYAKAYDEQKQIKIENTLMALDEALAVGENFLDEMKEADHALSQYQKFYQEETRKGQKRDQDFGLVRLFYDALSGNNPKGISLKRYILRTKFEEIIEMANLRFLKMTAHRFYFRLAEERYDKRKKWGLDLNVMDEFTGRMRPVNTLSGGESFMAALSLALGMSDVAQSYAGGIGLDTLFIDEGFGALDGEALDRAILILQELRQKGRFIGIISHVEELKERISAQVEVISTSEGAHIHYDDGEKDTFHL